MILKKNYSLWSHQLVIFVQIDVKMVPVKMEELVTILFHHISVSALRDSQERTATSVSSGISYSWALLIC